MNPLRLLGLAAMLGASLLMPQAARAQQTIESLGLTVTTTPAAVNNYLFRGISQSNNRPAGQLTLDIEHASGLYIGGFISNVAWPGYDIRQEVDGMAGYRFALGDVKLDLGFTYFGYPGYDAPPGGFAWSWWELNARANYEVGNFKFLGQVSWSPNFSYESGQAWYVEGGADIKLPGEFLLSLRAGYQWIEFNTTSPANHGSFGTPDYAVFSAGISREIIGGIVGALTVSGTTLSRNECFGGLKTCGTQIVVGLSRPF
jgi:uncharacterized protein (TIGR02001 family)